MREKQSIRFVSALGAGCAFGLWLHSFWAGVFVFSLTSLINEWCNAALHREAKP